MIKLREYRLKANLSRAQLAERAGVDERLVSNAENGKRIQDTKAYALAQTLSQILDTPLSIEDLEIKIYP